MQKSGHMILKGVNWVHNDKIRSRSNGHGKESIGYTMQNQVIWS